MADNYIIHAERYVSIADHLGIFNAETNKHTHKLRVILFKKNTCLSLDRYFFIYYETNIYCFAFNALYSAVISKAL
jgi:hypothetical protein